jgi:hypothetical protein
MSAKRFCDVERCGYRRTGMSHTHWKELLATEPEQPAF